MDNTVELDEASKQLLTLRVATNLTGVLHELQVTQIRMWSMLMVEHAQTIPEIRFSWENKELELFFKKLKKKNKASDLEDKLDTLTDWVQWLLGDEYLLRLRDDTGVFYRGNRKQKLEFKPKKIKLKSRHYTEEDDDE